MAHLISENTILTCSVCMVVTATIPERILLETVLVIVPEDFDLYKHKCPVLSIPNLSEGVRILYWLLWLYIQIINHI